MGAQDYQRKKGCEKLCGLYFELCEHLAKIHSFYENKVLQMMSVGAKGQIKSE